MYITIYYRTQTVIYRLLESPVQQYKKKRIITIFIDLFQMTSRTDRKKFVSWFWSHRQGPESQSSGLVSEKW